MQTKLTVSQPNDQYEQEADRVADQVLRMSESCVQRQTVPEEEEEEELQTKPLAADITPLVQRQTVPEEEEEELAQTKQSEGQGPRLVSGLTAQVRNLSGGGQTLPSTARRFFEPRFGYDFSRVRLHTDARSADTARTLNASAFTMGRDIFFGAGRYAPESPAGRKLLAHELAHVIQQAAR